MSTLELKPSLKKFKAKGFARKASSGARSSWAITSDSKEYVWTNAMERVELSRMGLSYETIEQVSSKAGIPISKLLQLIGLPQTTYNKKKREQVHLSGRDSELILILVEVLDFGAEVFNNELDKFQRWLKKPNLSLGDVAPESLFDTISGLQEVKNCLNRLEFGNMA